MPITKRPCANCPFRNDGAGIQLHPGRLEGIVSDLLADDTQTFVCHKTLGKERMTCAGALGLMSKLGRLPVIARLGLACGVITKDDVQASAAMVIDPNSLSLPSKSPANVMVEIEPDVYQAANGYTARREDGLTPNGNPVGQRFVLRDAEGIWVDFDQYRHDLFERNGLRPAY